MATKLMRAILASSPALLRASRSGLTSSRHVQLSSSRWASAAAVSPKIDIDASPRPFSKDDDAGAAITSAAPAFTTLKGRVRPELIKAITVRPFKLTHMSAVQAEVLPLLPGIAKPYDEENPPNERRDLLVKAKTGTGKTLGFLIPAVESRLNEIEKYVKKKVTDMEFGSKDRSLEAKARRVFGRTQAGCLIISPTRELATQIANEALRLTSHLDDFEVRLFVGGNSKRMQMRDWTMGRRDIVVATPGRMRDVLENEPDVAKSFEECPLLILDEADTLLEMGFREDITAISEHLKPKPERQTFLFSATVSREIQQIAKKVLSPNHLFVNCVGEDDSPVHAHVPQYHTVLPSTGHQFPHLLRLMAHDQLANPGNSKIIVFLPTTRLTQLFATFIREMSRVVLPAGRRTTVYEIHSRRTQESRTRTSDQFRRDKSGAAILITSDVSARGVDYPNVSRVIQVGIPPAPDQYVHRVGRTGRGTERQGRADLVLLPWEADYISWQLSHIPLKPLTVKELTAQTKALAESHDNDPAAFFEKAKNHPQGVSYRVPYAPILTNFEAEISKFLEKVDEDAIKEVMSSLLGFYSGRSSELRCQKSQIHEGLKEWTVEACGLASPPYISPSFLERIGMSGRGPQKSFGSGGRRQKDERHSAGPRWAGRGNVRARSDGARGGREERSGSFGSKEGRRSKSYGGDW